MKRILRLPAVKSATGLGRSELYDKIRRGEFPPQVKLGPKAVGWLESEVDAWIDQRVSERDGVTEPEAA
jgi:prophage regulatory protein